MKTNAIAPHFHVMVKPSGARCNLACAYCYFRKKDRLYSDSDFRMSDAVAEAFIRQTIAAHCEQKVTIAWQGGEPTLMGIDFFRRAVAMERRYAQPGMIIENTLQTNGVLIDEQWCTFLRENRFLVGLSLDGPRKLHDRYRRDKAGRSVFDSVVRAARLMQMHGVEFNILCTVNAANSRHPLEVYRYFRDELKTPYLQFIPIVERDDRSGNQEGTCVTDRTVRPEQYGRFLIEIFDEWVRRDVGSMFVQLFDGVLASYVRGVSTLCVLQPSCGLNVALEHTGDLYACDHFVEPNYLLGNIGQHSLRELVARNHAGFGQTKSATLPCVCRECEFLFTCHGECPKNRLVAASDGSGCVNWLCAGLRAFFTHTAGQMQKMAHLVRSGRNADGIMGEMKSAPLPSNRQIGRNDPCPCGSGIKYKRCHMH